jgi:HEPN domain-containing protein
VATPIDLAHRLVGLAGDDELAARSLLPVEGVTDALLGFHAQQAVEKSLKAVLASRGVEFRFIHDLDYLSGLCSKSGVELPSTLDGMQKLTPFAVMERYGSEEPLSLDRDQALTWSAAVVEWARSIIDSTDAAQAPASLD